jgi:uncharacterized phage protein gp47/JayE
MPRNLKSLTQMNADSLRYLANNTSITYLTEGSIARALVESTNLEISRLQQYIASTYRNAFPATAESFYLDTIGRGLGLPRLDETASASSIEDQNVKFSVASGRLGDYYPNPSNSNLGLIVAGTTISTLDETIVYKVSADTTFPINAKEAFVPVVAEVDGDSSNVGKYKLVVHSGQSAVNVTNLKEINNGSGQESDKLYRYRILNHMISSPSCNQLSIKLAVMGSPDIARVELREFARGAGTFDALLVPTGNTIANATADIVQQAINQASAFGISGRAIEPTYRKFKISVQLIPTRDAGSGLVDSAKTTAKNAILDYMETIPMGGELIVNRLRAAIIDAVPSQVKDIKIVDLCIDGRPHVIRNIKLKTDELFTPDVDRSISAVQVI